ncbi:MAG TPA: hypothetical protein VNW92_27745 [Polyangiaceae bacterium]|jgi:hypothetical protein|nr:hypothetical protein [Polyangiaceae bacterium]
MNEDLLAEATRALRETDDVSELEARATRARVMSGLHQTRVKHRTRYAFLLPIAATFVAASAWGAASGKAQLVWASIERIAHHSKPAPSSPASAGALRSLPRAAPPAALAPDESEQRAAPAEALTPTPAARPVASAAALTHKSDGPGGTRAEADPTFALYRAAHTAHFVDHDPARALAAWDAYLAAAPHGAFAPEAEYNRALSLVRLGRNSEAESALAPFANGAYGGYRQAEAQALLERIGH